jgi:hypothetical protein
MSVLVDQKVAELTARWGDPVFTTETETLPLWMVEVNGNYGLVDVLESSEVENFSTTSEGCRISVHHFLGSIGNTKPVQFEITNQSGAIAKFSFSTPMDVVNVPKGCEVKITASTPIALLIEKFTPRSKSNIARNVAHINTQANQVQAGQVLLWSAQRPMVKGEVSEELVLKNMFDFVSVNKPLERSSDPKLEAFWDRVDNPSSVEVRFFKKPTPDTSNGQSKNSFDFPATPTANVQSVVISNPSL